MSDLSLRQRQRENRKQEGRQQARIVRNFTSSSHHHHEEFSFSELGIIIKLSVSMPMPTSLLSILLYYIVTTMKQNICK